MTAPPFTRTDWLRLAGFAVVAVLVPAGWRAELRRRLTREFRAAEHAQRDAVLHIHRDSGGWCTCCGFPWPCDTARAVGAR